MRAAWQAVVVALGAIVLLAPPAPAARSKDPTALVRALLRTPIDTSSLPAALGTPKVLRIPLSENSKRHHGVGTVDVVFGEKASVVFGVFPTHADAVADFRAAPGHPGDTTARAPGSFPKPSKIISGTIALTTGKAGISAVEFVDGNVIVLAAATSTAGTTRGDVPTALALARFAQRRLAALRGAA